MCYCSLSNLIIKEICAVNRINVPPHKTVYKKNRERYAITIKTCGKTIFSSQQKDYISDPNHILILPKNATYSWVCIEPGECLMIEFETDQDFTNGNLKSIKINSIKEIITIFNRLEHLWTFKKPAYIIKCMAGLYEILIKLAESELLDYELSSKYDIIKPSVNYLETHYNDPDLNNEKLSEISGISTVYFRKLFSGLYNISPMKYIQLIRIEKAKDMLISDYFSVGDVATAVGFKSVYHFSKTFKKITGYTPTQFSRMHTIKAQVNK